jgi:hypothetical protein
MVRNFREEGLKTCKIMGVSLKKTRDHVMEIYTTTSVQKRETMQLVGRFPRIQTLVGLIHTETMTRASALLP